MRFEAGMEGGESAELLWRGDMSTVVEWPAKRKSNLGTWLSVGGI